MSAPVSVCWQCCMPWGHANFRQCILHALRMHADPCQSVQGHADLCQSGLHAFCACRLRSICAACRMRMPTSVNACCMLWVCMLTCVSVCGCMLTSVSVGCMPYVHADPCRRVLLQFVCWRAASVGAAPVTACRLLLPLRRACYRADSQLLQPAKRADSRQAGVLLH